MKRTFSGSFAQKGNGAPAVHLHTMGTSSSKFEALQIPKAVFKHIEYLSRFPPSKIYEWVEALQKFKGW